MRIFSVSVLASIFAGMAYATPEERYLREGPKTDDKRFPALKFKHSEQKEEDSTLDDDDDYEYDYNDDSDDDSYEDTDQSYGPNDQDLAADLYDLMISATREMDAIKTPEDVSAIADLRHTLHDFEHVILLYKDYNLRTIAEYGVQMMEQLNPLTAGSLKVLKRVWADMKKELENTVEYGG